MLVTTSTFNNAIKSNGRELYVRATIGAKAFDYANTVSFTVEETVASEELQLGTATCASFELEVNNQDGYLDTVTFENSQVNLEIGIKTSAGVEYVALGKFNIDKSEKKNKSINLKGFDNMIKAEVPFIDNLIYPATLAQIAQAACTQAGLTLVSTTFNNSNYQAAQKFYSSGATCRDVLAYVAGASGGFARCTRDGKIEIVWVTNTTVNIQPENWINLSVKELKAGPINRLIISKNDGVVTGDHFSIEDNVSITANGEYALIIKDNPLLIDNMEGALNPIFNQVKGLTFNPYSMTWQGNPALQALDKIKVTNELGVVFDTLITSQKLVYAGGLKCEMKCAGKSNTARTYKREGPINKRIKYAEITLDKQAAEIALKASSEEVEGLNQRLSNAEINLQPESIALRVSYSNAYAKLNKKELNSQLQLTRPGLSINPLETYNFTTGSIFANDVIVALQSEHIENRSYVPDLAIVNNQIYSYEEIPLEGMEERLSEAEFKITNESIVATVTNSTEYTQSMASINNAISTAQNTANSKASPSYVNGKAAEAETNAIDYADILGEEIETNAKGYTDRKKAEIDNVVNILTGRVANAEEKITPEAITQTVTESNTYKSYNFVPNKARLTATRNAPVINPLNAYNFSGGSSLGSNELITVGGSLSGLVYTADLQITNNEIVTFDKPADRIETAESKIEQTAHSISLVVKADGTIDGNALTAAINMSSSKIEMSALNINLAGYVTFNSLSTAGATSIHGGNIITDTISFNTLKDKPFIPSQYTDGQALQAWVASGYKTYIDSTGAYIGSIKANQLLIGGANGSISFNNLIDKPFIPTTASQVGAISSTYIDANGVFTPQVYANNINVSQGKITADKIDVDTLSARISRVSDFIDFTGNPLNGIGNMIGGPYVNYLGLIANHGVYMDTDNVYTKTGRVATREWVTQNVGGSTATFG